MACLIKVQNFQANPLLYLHRIMLDKNKLFANLYKEVLVKDTKSLTIVCKFEVFLSKQMFTKV